MSLDKAEKSTGTRHKARECALQMLFAFDFCGNANFRAEDYWGQLGLEQLHRGVVDLVAGFHAEVDKAKSRMDALATLRKEIDYLDKKNARSEDLKALAAKVTSLRQEFSRFFESFVRSHPPDSSRVYASIVDFSSRFDSIAAGLLLVEKAEKSLIEEAGRLRGVINQQFAELQSRLSNIDAIFTGITPYRDFANALVTGTTDHLTEIDARIKTRAEHWRIERMAIVDRNVLRLAVYEFLYTDTPNGVAINEALETARRFSSFEATQFINGILDGIKLDLDGATENPEALSQASSQ